MITSLFPCLVLDVGCVHARMSPKFCVLCFSHGDSIGLDMSSILLPRHLPLSRIFTPIHVERHPYHPCDFFHQASQSLQSLAVAAVCHLRGGRPAVHVQLLRMQANPGPAMAPMQPGMRPMEPGMRPMDPGMSPMDPGMSPMQLGMSPMQLGMSPMQPGMSHWGMPGPPPRRW